MDQTTYKQRMKDSKSNTGSGRWLKRSGQGRAGPIERKEKQAVRGRSYERSPLKALIARYDDRPGLIKLFSGAALRSEHLSMLTHCEP